MNTDTSLPLKKTYHKKERIFLIEDEKSQGALVISGTVFLENIDTDGIRHVLDCFAAGDFIWNPLLRVEVSDSLVLIARSECQLQLFQTYDPESLALAGPQLQARQIFTDTQQRLLAHIHMLEQHSIRNKILALLQYYSQHLNSKRFQIPMSLTDAADYLAVDRSAMMREIGNMEKDGLFRHKGRLFELLS